MNIKKHIPNVLSTLRLVMALTMPIVFFNATLLFTTIFYIIGDITDLVDGFLARTWKVQSKYGKIVDPIADKLFNGITLILTSLFVNPTLFVLTALEALIASINILRIQNRSEIDVSKIGKTKTVLLFLAIISAFVNSMVPGINKLSSSLIILTSLFQVATAGKYLKEYHKEKTLEKESEKNNIQIVEDNNKKSELGKLKILRNKLKQLSNHTNLDKTKKLSNDIVIDNDENNIEDIYDNKDVGISRTLKK